jgi:hypothetical protein
MADGLRAEISTLAGRTGGRGTVDAGPQIPKARQLLPVHDLPPHLSTWGTGARLRPERAVFVPAAFQALLVRHLEQQPRVFAGQTNQGDRGSCIDALVCLPTRGRCTGRWHRACGQKNHRKPQPKRGALEAKAHRHGRTLARRLCSINWPSGRPVLLPSRMRTRRSPCPCSVPAALAFLETPSGNRRVGCGPRAGAGQRKA